MSELEKYANRVPRPGEVTIETVRDLMCHEDRSLTPEQAATILKERYPHYSYEALLESARLVEEVKEIVKKNRQCIMKKRPASEGGGCDGRE